MLEPLDLAKYIGFTEEEVHALCDKYDMDYEQAMEWYDGYSFDGASHICGPNSIVRAMFHRKYNNYWSQTVAYNSLAGYITMNFDGLKDDIKMMMGGLHVKVKVRGYQNDMTSFKNKDDVLTVLIHLGYLAFDSEKSEAYIPNKEVRMCFEDTLDATCWDELVETLDNSERLLEATIAGDSEEVAAQIDECHMKIVDKPAMIIELKWKKNAGTSIKQIKDKKYVAGLEGYHGKVLLVGISYDKLMRGETDKIKEHSCSIEEIEM